MDNQAQNPNSETFAYSDAAAAPASGAEMPAGGGAIKHDYRLGA